MVRLFKRAIASVLSFTIFMMTFNSMIYASEIAIGDTTATIEEQKNLDEIAENHAKDEQMEQEQAQEDSSTTTTTADTSGEVEENVPNTDDSSNPTTEVILEEESTSAIKKDAIIGGEIIDQDQASGVAQRDAKDITNLITQQKGYPLIKQGNQVIGHNERLDYTKAISIEHYFRIPVIGDEEIDSSKPDTYAIKGDYVLFPIPKGLKVNNVIDEDVTYRNTDTGEDVVIGKLHLAQDGARVTFNEKVQDEEMLDLLVKVSFDLHYDRNHSEMGVPGTHTIKILDKTFIVEIPEIEPVIELTKTGELDKENKVINWKVKVFAQFEDGNKANLSDYDFIDDLTNVGEYIKDSFKVSSEDNKETAQPPSDDTTAEIVVHSESDLNADGEAITPEEPKKRFTVDNNVIKYDFKEQDGDTQYLYFQTRVPDEKFFTTNGATITNTCNISKKDVVKKTASANVQIPNYEWISKTGSLRMDGEDRYIDWTIKLNKTDFNLGTIKVQDTLTKELEWVGAKWVSSAPADIKVITEKPVDDIYTLENVNTAVDLVITTKIKPEVSSIGEKKIHNTAKLILGTEENPIELESQTQVKVGFDPLFKTGIGYDIPKRELSWRVTYDPKEHSFGQDLKIFDLLVYKEHLDYNNLQVDGKDCGEFLRKIDESVHQEYVNDSFKLTKGSADLDLYPVMQGDERVADLLVLKPKDTENLEAVTYEYKTKLNDPRKFAVNGKCTVYNTVALFSGDKFVFKKKGEQKSDGNVVDKDGISVANAIKIEENPKDITNLNQKSAGRNDMLNYSNKSAMFRIHVNHNNQDLTEIGEITIRDTMKAEFELADIGEEPFLLYEGSPGKNKQVLAGRLIPKEEYEEFLTYEVNGQNVDFKFKNITRPYLIVVKIKLKDEKIEEQFSTTNKVFNSRNDATFINAHIPKHPTDWEDFSYKSDILNKSLDIKDKDKKGHLIWKINYKPYEIEREGICLKDELPYGIELLRDKEGNLQFGQDSIFVRELKMSSNGNYVQGDLLENPEKYISYDNKTRTLRFNFPDSSKGYFLEYRTEITGEPGPVTNKATLEGSIEEIKTTQSNATYEISAYDVQASLKRGAKLDVVIKDDKGNPIQGVEVSLINKNGEVVRQAVSKENGSLIIKAVPEGEYIIRETTGKSDKYVESTDEFIVKVIKDENGKMKIVIDGKEFSSKEIIDIEKFTKDSVGNLKVSNEVLGEGADKNKKFAFTLKLPKLKDINKAFPYTIHGVGGEVVKNGVIKNDEKFELSDGENIIIENIPDKTNYIIEQDNYIGQDYQTKYDSNNVGFIRSQETKETVVVNTYKIQPGTITISNTFSDELEYEIKLDSKIKDEFIYTIVKADGTKIEKQVSKGGTLKFKLNKNDTIYISSIPFGTKYQVTIKDSAGNNIDIVGSQTGEITESNKTTEIIVRNKPVQNTDTTTGQNEILDNETVVKDKENISKVEENTNKQTPDIIENTFDNTQNINSENYKSIEEVIKDIGVENVLLLEKMAKSLNNSVSISHKFKSLALDGTAVVEGYEQTKQAKNKIDTYAMANESIVATNQGQDGALVDGYSANKKGQDEAVVDGYSANKKGQDETAIEGYAAKTGDNSILWVNIISILLGSMALIFVIGYKRKKFKN